MDSGAFTEISNHGRYRHSVEEYAAEINRWADDPNLVAAIAAADGVLSLSASLRVPTTCISPSRLVARGSSRASQHFRAGSARPAISRRLQR